jgi:hypothetical protein
MVFDLTLLSGLFKTSKSIKQALATDDDLAELNGKYHEYFSSQQDDDGPVINDIPQLSFSLSDVDRSDLGMEAEARLSPDTLAKNLGFIRQNLPYQFQPFRHKTGITAWDQPASFNVTTRASLVEMKLHWHQLAGVHSIIRNTFTSKPKPDHCTGMLICDEVGLGKTALSIATIAFLNQAVILQEFNEPLPPILSKYLNIRCV